MPPRDIGLALFDLDGTILLGGEDVRPRVVAALRHAHERGVTLAVASGRPIEMIPAALRDLGVMDYYICTNGATVYDAELNRVMDAGMPGALARGVMWALAPLAPSWSAFVDGRGYIELRGATYMVASRGGARAAGGGSLVRGLRRGLRILLGLGDFHQVVSIRGVLAHAATVEKLGCTFASDAAARAATRLLADAGLEVAAMGGRELEITAAGVTKGSAAAWLISRLGVNAAGAVAFGDGGNDAPLVPVVGTFVAMGNADPALKAVATCVCGTVDDDGVATWLEARLARGDGLG